MRHALARCYGGLNALIPIQKDVYVEYRVRRKTRGSDIFIRVMLVLLLMILFTMSFLLSPLMGSLAFIAYGITAFGFVYAWKFQKKLSIEYEYIFTNGSLDIDKILGKEERKRLYTVECKDMEFFEPYRPEKLESQKFDRRGFPCFSPADPNLYCFAYRDRTAGRSLVCINVSDELRGAISDAYERANRFPSLKNR